VLERLVGAAAEYLYVARLPTTARRSFVLLQRAYVYGYETEYLGWVLDRQEFLGAASGAGAELEREFLMREPLTVSRAPSAVEFRGFLLRTRRPPAALPSRSAAAAAPDAGPRRQG
jgi:hypothetical protein